MCPNRYFLDTPFTPGWPAKTMIRTPVNANPAARAQRSRRAREHPLTDADREHSLKRIRLITQNSRAKETLKNYESYKRSIDDYYDMEHPDLCLPEGGVDFDKIRGIASSAAGLDDMASKFKIFLQRRKHHKDIDPATGEKAPARAGSLSGYRSTFAYFGWTHGLDSAPGVPARWNSSMLNFFRGLKNDEAEKRHRGEMSMKEGKSKMTFDLYYHLGLFFHREGKIDCAFQNSFGWNLMARHFNVDTLCAEAFGFYVDAITVQYGKDKTHTDGGKSNQTAMLKHVYANPFMPEVRTPVARMHMSRTHTQRHPHSSKAVRRSSYTPFIIYAVHHIRRSSYTPSIIYVRFVLLLVWG